MIHTLSLELDDHTTEAITTGEGDGPPIVLVHACMLDQHMWRGTRARLPGHRTISYDLRGHGSASGSPIRDIAQLAGDLHSLLQRMSIPDAHLVGVSLGGAIVQHLVAESPDLARSLVLVATSSQFPKKPLLERADSLDLDGRDKTTAITLQRWFRPSDLQGDNESVAYTRSRLSRASISTWSSSWSALAGVDLNGRLANFPGAVSCIAGAEDQSTPPQALQSIADNAPNGRFEVLPSAPHMLPLTHPHELASSIARHLDGLG